MRCVLHLPQLMRCVAVMFSLGLFSAPGISFARSAQPMTAQSTTQDPGPRGGTPAAGGPMPGLNNIEIGLFFRGAGAFCRNRLGNRHDLRATQQRAWTALQLE